MIDCQYKNYFDNCYNLINQKIFLSTVILNLCNYTHYLIYHCRKITLFNVNYQKIKSKLSFLISLKQFFCEAKGIYVIHICECFIIFSKNILFIITLLLLQAIINFILRTMTQYTPKKLNKSTLLDHNIYNSTDKLYDPLRKIAFNPQTANDDQSPKIAKSTLLSDSYKKLSPQDINQIKHEIYIPLNKELIPTDDFSKVQNKNIRIIDARQEVIGKPIPYEELMKKLQQQKPKQQKIVYELGTQDAKIQRQSNFYTGLFNKQDKKSNLKSQIFGEGQQSWRKSPQSPRSPLKKSTIEDHNIFDKSDKLYDPLRFVINSPKNKTRQLTNWKSMLSDNFKQITEEQAQKIKKDILIPVDAQLVPSNIQILPHKNFVIIQATQTKYAPIPQQQVLKRIKSSKKSQILYEIKQDPILNVRQDIKLISSKSHPVLPQVKSQETLTASVSKKIDITALIPDYYNYNKNNLKKAQNFDLIKNKKFHIIDTRQRQLEPISEAELKAKLSTMKQQKVIYEFENTQKLKQSNQYLKQDIVNIKLNEALNNKQYTYNLKDSKEDQTCGLCNGCWSNTTKLHQSNQ